MILGTLAYLWLGRNVAVYNDRFFILTISVTLIAATAYLAMAMGMGKITINGKEIVIARFIDWALTTPLIIALLGLLAQASKELIATLIGIDLYMIGAGVIGLTAEPLWQTLVWWGVGMVAYLVFLYLLLGALSSGAEKQAGELNGVYTTLRNLTIVLWTIYPAVYILGGSAFGVLPGVVEEGAIVGLDVLSKVVFGYIVLSSHETIRVHSFYGEERGTGATPESAD